VVSVPQVAQKTIDDAVEAALAAALPGDSAHLARAVIAERIAAVAKHKSKDEVAAALEKDGTSWDDIAHAFGISTHDAHEHFRTAPMGLPE
jgi:tripartite-type tricarboxylate transporter receptor subunit TctC